MVEVFEYLLSGNDVLVLEDIVINHGSDSVDGFEHSLFALALVPVVLVVLVERVLLIVVESIVVESFGTNNSQFSD